MIRKTLVFWLVATLFSIVTACSITYGTEARRSLAQEFGVKVSHNQSFAYNQYQGCR